MRASSPDPVRVVAKRLLASVGLLDGARAARMRWVAWRHAAAQPSDPEALRALYDDSYFQEYHYSINDPGEEVIKEAQAELIQRAIGPVRLLDCGCAAGELVRAFRRRGVDAWGFDFSPSLDEIVYAEVRPFVRYGTLTDIPFGPEDRFDALLMIDVLEHLPARSVPRAVAEFARLRVPWLVTLISHDDLLPGHVTLRPLEWWERKLRPRFRLVSMTPDRSGIPAVHGLNGDPAHVLRFWRATDVPADRVGGGPGGRK